MLAMCYTRRLLVRDHFANVGDVFFDPGDLVWPGLMVRIGVWFSGSILFFRFCERDGKVFQLLFKRRTGHKGRLSLGDGVGACPLV